MSDRLETWSVRREEGNPTKSIPVNDLIKLVKKKEVRHQGKESQARGPFIEDEFEFVMEQFENKVMCEQLKMKKHTYP